MFPDSDPVLTLLATVADAERAEDAADNPGVAAGHAERARAAWQRIPFAVPTSTEGALALLAHADGEGFDYDGAGECPDAHWERASASHVLQNLIGDHFEKMIVCGMLPCDAPTFRAMARRVELAARADGYNQRAQCISGIASWMLLPRVVAPRTAQMST